jgi:tetratricopeptide (TPR) repeat protein
MSWLRRRSGYDRATLLDAAARARSRKKRPLAIELYRRVLAVEPHNPELHTKLAPLLAETGQNFDAWQSFRAVARGHLREGHVDRALAVYRDAALYLPQEIQAWQAVARLQHRSGRQQEARETLLEASRNFRTRWLRPQAIVLLRRARDFDAWDFEIVLELARLLASDDQGLEAAMLLDGLVERSRGHRLQRVRATQLRYRPRFATLWSWLRAALQRRDPGTGIQPTGEPQRRAVTKPGAILHLHTARRG